MTPACFLVLLCALTAVPRVIDGDTIAFEAAKVRLWGIDSPEMDTAAGKRAKAALESLIDGREVTCVPKDRDRYRRVVAICSVNGQDLARLMVEAGQAEDWPRYSKGYYSQK